MSFFYRIPDTRYCEIQEFAEFLWDEYSENGQIDPIDILRQQKITHTFSDYQNAFDGLLEYRHGKFHVYLNQSRLRSVEKPRCRFTVSHELGHFFLDEHRNGLISGTIPQHGSFPGYQTNAVIEIEADHFASHLLMPASQFTQKLARERVGFEGIVKLSEAFGTSRTACAVRYVKDGALPCALFKWSNNGLDWKLLSDEFYRLGFRRSVETIDRLLDGSPTHQILRGWARPAGIVTAGTTASSWFPHISAGNSRNEILIEEAISLGPYGALTLVYRKS